MRTFKVYRHPTRGLQVVKVGFSWPAFFIPGIWMLVKRLWGIAATFYAVYFALFAIQRVTDAAQSDPRAQALVYLMLAVGYFAAWLVLAFKGNSWCESNLVSRGYELAEEVIAETPDAAVAKTAPPKASLEESYSQQHFSCTRCQHRISQADPAWDRLVADRRCPSCHLPVTVS